MPDPFDDAKDALAGTEPTTDLWAEASRRAASGDVVELTSAALRPRRGRWLAAAAAVAVVAGTVGVLSLGDDAKVDTAPSDPSGEPTIYEGEEGCSFGITGEPPIPRQFGPAEDPVPGTHFAIGDLTARVNVPMWTDPIMVTYELAPVELDRGTAGTRALGDQSTIVQWWPDTPEVSDPDCSSFSVSVSGGGPDLTEPAAVALADRIVLQSELPQEDTTTTSIFPSAGCFFSVGGEPVTLEAGPSDPALFDPAGQPEGQTIAHATLGSQRAEVHVPGVVLTDLVGERVEDIELGRGTAQVWFGPDFVQVRWFPGTEEPCDSFTVTVTGSTEDGNRHAAVDLADRISLSTEIGVDEPPITDEDVTTLLEGDWRLESSTIDGEPTDGDGLRFTFLDGEASWTDGCNDMSGPYVATGDDTFRLGAVLTTYASCPPNPTAEAVDQVMSSEQIEVSVEAEGGFLILTANGGELTLRPIERDASSAPSASSLIGTTWVVTALREDSTAIALPAEADVPPVITVAFSEDNVTWRPDCNTHARPIRYETDVITPFGDGSASAAGCSATATSFMTDFFETDAPIELEIGPDMLVLSRGNDLMRLRPE